MDKKTIYLIDASSFIWRAFYGLPLMSNSKGQYVNAVSGFGSMLINFLNSKHIIPNSKILVIQDAEKKNFRHEIYPLYKSNRKETPKELGEQFAVINELLQSLNLTIAKEQGYEADDLIASYSKQLSKQGISTVLISSDKDLMQLIDDNIKMYDPAKDKWYGKEEVVEKFGVFPNQVAEFQAISGDSSDGIPGILGLGPKGASSLIQEYKTLDGIYKNIDKITPLSKKQKLENGKENAYLSLQLTTLKEDILLPLNYDDVNSVKFDQQKIIDFCEKYELNKLKSSVLKYISNTQEKGNIEIKTMGCQELLNHINNKEKVYLYPFFENNKLSNLSVFNSGNSYNLQLQNSKTDLFESVIKQSDICLKELFSDTYQKVIYDTKNLMHILNKEYQIQIQNYDDISVLLFSIYGMKYGSDFKNQILNIIGKNIYLKSDDERSSGNAYIISLLHQNLKENISLISKEIYENIDLPLLKVLYLMEEEGILINKEILQKLKKEYEEIIIKIKNDTYQITGFEFNLSSPKQVGKVLFEDLKLPYPKKKTESYDTSVEVLKYLASENYLIAKLLLEHRAYSKIVSTYLDAMIDVINNDDKRIHTTFLQNNTNTARLASVNPNLQNLPVKSKEGKQIRNAFIAKSGYNLISCDYSQIELRILASIANVSNMIKAFENDADIHLETAKKIFEEVEISSTQRRYAKMINFGIVYGMSSFGLSQTLGVSKLDAKKFIDDYFKIYPEILIYMKDRQKQARELGYVETLLGRRIYFQDTSGGLNYISRASINAPIQGTCSDILRIAMVKMQQEITQKKLDAKLLLQIHDELVFEVSEQETENFIKILKEIMENIIQLKVPLKLDVFTGKNLYDIH